MNLLRELDSLIISINKSDVQVCNFITKRFEHRCFYTNIVKFLKTSNLRKICERLLLDNVDPNFSSIYLNTAK